MDGKQTSLDPRLGSVATRPADDSPAVIFCVECTTGVLFDAFPLADFHQCDRCGKFDFSAGAHRQFRNRKRTTPRHSSNQEFRCG